MIEHDIRLVARPRKGWWLMFIEPPVPAGFSPSADDHNDTVFGAAA